MFKQKQEKSYNTARSYIQNKESVREVYLTTAVHDILNQSKRDNRELMDKLSNCSNSPTPRNQTQSLQNSNKKVRFEDMSHNSGVDSLVLSSYLRRSQIKSQAKLDHARAKQHQLKMRECRHKPDLTKTSRFNMKISKSMVDLRRERSIQKYLDKSDKEKQEILKQMSMKDDGCTFRPRINQKSKYLDRNLSALFTPPDSKNRKVQKLFQL